MIFRSDSSNSEYRLWAKCCKSSLSIEEDFKPLLKQLICILDNFQVLLII